MTPGVILWCSRFLSSKALTNAYLTLRFSTNTFLFIKPYLTTRSKFIISSSAWNWTYTYLATILLCCYCLLMLVFSGIDEFLWGHISPFVILLSYHLVHVWVQETSGLILCWKNDHSRKQNKWLSSKRN